MTPIKLSDLAAGAPIHHWLVLGPFVVKTPGHFEREYLYERHRILDIDYLAEDGGEASVVPEAGRTHRNTGLGAKQLAWSHYPHSEVHGIHIAGDLIYETVQRNCVIYAAATIQSEHEGPVLLDAYHSGMKVWMNGELVCNEPYGIPKGVRVTMPSKLVHLRQGTNFLLVKFRPGYISDGIDFQVRDVRLSPLAAERGLPLALGRARALPLFIGTVAQPRQIIEATLINTSHTAQRVDVSLTSDILGNDEVQHVDCEPGALVRMRLSLLTQPESAGELVHAIVKARVYGRELVVPIDYRAALPPKYEGTSFVLTSFHFDTTYHEEQRVYAMGAFDIVRQYCRLHRTDPNFRSIISEADYLKPYFDVFPEDRNTLRRVFRERRSEPDVMYNQPNEQNCGGEALVRNFLYGQLFHGLVLGNICHVYGPGDVFGHPNQLSQIARKSGCIGVTWDKCIYNFPPFFDHLALDGTAIPHKRGPAEWDEVHVMGLSVTTGEIDQTPPTDWHGTLLPRVQQGVYSDLISRILEQQRPEGEAEAAHLPVTSRDMSLYHAATAMSRSELKIANRLGENLLLTAEKFATLAALLGATYPDKALDKAWRQILCGQHHDSITGTHNELSFVDLMNAYREVLELGQGVLDDSLDYLGHAIDANGAQQPLVVFNSLAWERTDIVYATIAAGAESFAILDHRGKDVPFEVCGIKRNAKGESVSVDVAFVAKRLPSLGYRVYQITSSKKKLPERKCLAGHVIENKYYRIEIDPERGGGIVSLYDKEGKREVMPKRTAHVGNELAVLEEVADREETQHEFYTTGLKMFSSEFPADVEIEEGAVTSTLRVRYRMGEMFERVVQEITLIKGVRRIEFRTLLLDYQGEDNLFCVTFPTSIRGAVPVFDERFGSVVRNESRGYLDFRTHRQIMFSDCAVYAANKWMEYGSSATLKAGRNTYALGMIGLITPKTKTDIAVAETVQKTLITKGITCTPWYDKDGPHWGSYQHAMNADLLYTRFRISLGSRGRNVYSKRLLKAQKANVQKAFAGRLKRNGYAYLVAKDTELVDHKGDAWPALPVLIVEAADAERLAEAVDAMLADFAETAFIELPAEADATGETRTVDKYGIAVLNQGTYANSVEKGGVICMMLAHTCRWYGGTNNFAEGYLVPENRHHVFRYALYPHAGNWREANTERAGYEFNYPLAARETRPAKKTSLPPEESFVRVSAKNVILAAMKPWGNPIASFQKETVSDPANGIMLRLYDAEGVNASARIEFAGGIKEAWSANLLEKRQGDLALADEALVLPVAPFSIETVGVVPSKSPRKIGRKTLGAEAEPVQPVWVRSWEHDAESMPMGYAAVVCSISREIAEDGSMLRLKVNAVNDYTDAPVTGNATLILPAGWSAEPASISFDLPPLGFMVTEVAVQRPQPDACGQVKLRYEWDGQEFQDVLEIGQPFELTMNVENRGESIVVELHNPTNEMVAAEVSLVSPLESWPSALVGGYSLLEIAPRTQGIQVAPGDDAQLTFKVTACEGAAEPSYWAVAKLMSNGRISVRRCDRTPERRLMDDHKWNAMLDARLHRERRK